MNVLQVNKARGLDPQAKAEAEVERSAHRETMEALELSENTVSYTAHCSNSHRLLLTVVI